MKCTLRSIQWLACVIPCYIVACNAQISTAACYAQYQWMSNSRNQDPCVVAAYLQKQCTPDETFMVIGLHGDGPYNPPPLDGANPCRCNPVVYSLLSACSVCQGGNTNSWTEWTQNCPFNVTAEDGYPEAVPFQTLIPRWAETLPSQTNGTFNVTRARMVSASETSPAVEGHRKLSVAMIVAIVLSALGTVLLVVGAFAVYQFRKPVAAPLAEGKGRPQADDENQFNSLRSAKSFESRYSGLSVGEGRRSSRIETTNDHEEHPFLGDERPRSYSQPATMERLYDPPATSVSSHGGGHEELDSRPALPPHSFTYPPVASSPTSMSSSSFYRYDPFNPPEPDELSSGSHPPPTSPYTPGKHIRELSFPPPKKALSPVTYEPYSPSSPRTRLVSPTSPRQQTHLRGGSGSYNRP